MVDNQDGIRVKRVIQSFAKKFAAFSLTFIIDKLSLLLLNLPRQIAMFYSTSPPNRIKFST